MGLISFCDTRENFLRFFSSFVPPSFSSFSYEGSLKKQLKCNSKHRSPMRICHSSISMLGFEPPKLLVQVSLYYFVIAALLVDSHIYVCIYNIEAQSPLNYTGAGVYTQHVDVIETDRQRHRKRQKAGAQAKTPLFILNVHVE